MAYKLYSYKGEVGTVNYFAKKYNLYGGTIQKRLQMGWSIAQALEAPRRRYNNKFITLTYKGETRTFVEWERITGIRRDTIKARLRKNWAVGQALGLEPKAKKDRSSLCWQCAKTAADCPWVARLEPIEGWEAQKTTIRYQGAEYKSYCVTQCPNFEWWDKAQKEAMRK